MIEITASTTTLSAAETVLTKDVIALLLDLQGAFGERVDVELARRRARHERIRADGVIAAPGETADVRESAWTVAPAPPDLECRWVEITGPPERKMAINALNSGADVWLADFEDATTPTWANLLTGQANLVDAIGRTISVEAPNRTYRLSDRPLATIVVRPRGWHLAERHVLVEQQPMSAALFDFGTFLALNAVELLERGSGPYFYLPKLESHHEARLWNDVFVFAEERLGLPARSIRATVLIETITAAFEMDEILFELRDRICGINAGRWDYLFSFIKRFRDAGGRFVLPDRASITMRAPLMEAYAEQLVWTAHRRGAHAMGGMSAFIPSRRDPEVNERAIAAVRADKEREALAGFDGSWVAHPDLVPVCAEAFTEVLGTSPNQLRRPVAVPDVIEADLLEPTIPDAAITIEGVRNNVAVALRYFESWLRGNGAVGIFDLMEDLATAEIARSQLWQWAHHGATTTDGTVVDSTVIDRLLDEELRSVDGGTEDGTRWADARQLIEVLLDADAFPEFASTVAMELID